MATIESSSNSLSPRLSGNGGLVSNNDRPSKLPSAWTEIVRGGGGGDPSSSPSESTANTSVAAIQSPPLSTSSSTSPSDAPASEKLPNSSSSSVKQKPRQPGPVPAQPYSASPESFTEGGDLGNCSTSNVGGNEKKPVWNKPSNGTTEGSASVVMGAASWPALSESTRPLRKLSSAESSSPSPAVDALLATQGARSSNSHPRQASDSVQRNHAPSRQRSMKRGNGGNRHGGFPRGPSVPAASPPPFPSSAADVSQNGFVPAVPLMSNPLMGVGVPSYHPNDYPMQRVSARRGRSGEHSHRNGVHTNRSGGGHHDQEHGNTEWNSGKFNPRKGSGRGFRAPQRGTPFVRPYGNPLVYPDGTPQFYYLPSFPMDPFGGYHFVRPGPPPPPPSLFVPYTDPSVHSSIRQQIDYYFSDANLPADEYLKSKMDIEGWVPIQLIADFPRVQKLTSNIQLILDIMRESDVVQVEGDKIRKRDGWEKWILRHLFSDSSVVSPNKDDKRIATSLQKISLEGVNETNEAECSNSTISCS